MCVCLFVCFYSFKGWFSLKKKKRRQRKCKDHATEETLDKTSQSLKTSTIWPLTKILLTSALDYFLVVVQSLSCVCLCNPMDCSTPGFSVLRHLLELAQTHVYWVSDAIQPSHPLSSPSPPAFNLSQQQGLFQWVSSLHQVAKVSELQLQHQSLQWTPRTDLL